MGLRIPKPRALVRRQARNWLVRLQSRREPGVDVQFRRWYESDPAHAAVFDSVSRNFELAGLLRQSPLSRQRALKPDMVLADRTPAFAWAAAIAMALLLPTGWYLAQRRTAAERTGLLMLMTGVGEIRTVDLEDGSKLILDTSTELELDLRNVHRRARLKRGRARFQIAVGPSAFLIDAGTTRVISRGSTIEVTGGGERSRVEVVSGSAEVRTPRGGMVVRAGETVTASSSGIERSGAGSGGAAWTRGMLEFDSARLASVVELANGYSETKIQLSGAIGELRVTGAFRAGDPEGLAKALSAAFRLSLARSAKGNFVLKAPANKNGG